MLLNLDCEICGKLVHPAKIKIIGNVCDINCQLVKIKLIQDTARQLDKIIKESKRKYF